MQLLDSEQELEKSERLLKAQRTIAENQSAEVRRPGLRTALLRLTPMAWLLPLLHWRPIPPDCGADKETATNRVIIARSIGGKRGIGAAAVGKDSRFGGAGEERLLPLML